MSEPDNLILQYLRKFDTKLDRLGEDMRDVKFRLGQVEQGIVNVNQRLDRFDERLTRVENRLGMLDPQH